MPGVLHLGQWVGGPLAIVAIVTQCGFRFAMVREGNVTVRAIQHFATSGALNVG